jgi:hypothetical protein
MRRMIPILITLALLTGCTMAQVKQEFLGLSADDVKADKNRQIITFNMSGPDCVTKIKDTLASMKAIVREDKDNHYIYADNFQKAFRSTIDTTQVGIVVIWLEPEKCRVETASHNIDLAVFVSKELSKKLNFKAEPQAVKKQSEVSQ